MELIGKECLENFKFSVVVDDDASRELKQSALVFGKELASLCKNVKDSVYELRSFCDGSFYKKPGSSFEEYTGSHLYQNARYCELKSLLSKVKNDIDSAVEYEELIRLESKRKELEIERRYLEMEHVESYFRDCLSKDPTEGEFELPDLKHFFDSGSDESNSNLANVDSILVEDVVHCSPEMVKKYPISAPSVFDVRQLKHREIVMFDGSRVYPEYAIVFYQYESEEEMLKNIPYEFPQYPHDPDNKMSDEEKNDVLFFVKRDLAKEGEEPDCPPEPQKGEPPKPSKQLPPECFVFERY